MHLIYEYLYRFFIYAFLGYICEVIYVSILSKKLSNRGYLYGPICPIYGFGGLFVILSLKFFYDNNMWYLVLLFGIFLTSTLEYLTSFVLELIFHMRWWDYSDKFMNIKGRICLRNSLMFGALVMVVFYILEPYMINNILRLLSNEIIFYTFGSVLAFVFIVDFVLSTIKHINFSLMLKKLEEYKDVLYRYKLETKDKIYSKIEDIKNYSQNELLKMKEFIASKKVIDKINNFKKKYPTFKFKTKKNDKISLDDIVKKRGDIDE